MATKKTKKQILITQELAWYQEQLDEAKDYLSKIDLRTIEDRKDVKFDKKTDRTVYGVVSSKEEIAEHKFRLIEKLPKLLAGLNELKIQEEEQKEAKGGVEKPAWAETKEE